MASGGAEGGKDFAAARSPMKNLVPRILSASVLIPLALLSVWAGSWALFALVLIANLLMLHEWFALTRSGSRLLEAFCGVVLAAVLAVATLGYVVEAIVLMTGGAFLSRALAGRDRATLLPGWGLAYIGLPSLLLIDLRGSEPDGLGQVLWLFVVVWALDIGAYFSGKFIGGPKLAPRLSPNKTWAGLIGGLVLCAVAALIVEPFLTSTLNITIWPHHPALIVGMAVLLGIVSQLGDIGESMLKRRAGVKDAGSIIPGHGGVLDRVDGLMAATPVMWGALALFGASQ